MLGKAAVGIGILASALALPAVGADSDSRPTVELALEPDIVRLLPGERRQVAVVVKGIPAAGLSAFQFTLQFDPAEIEVLDPNAAFVAGGVPAFAPLGGSPLCAAVRQLPVCPDPQWLLTASGRQAFGTNTVDLRNGAVTIAYGTAGAAAPATGGGALAWVEVVGKRGGRLSLRTDNAIVADGADPPNKYLVQSSSQTKPPKIGPRE